jgi:hypothetical protein
MAAPRDAGFVHKVLGRETAQERARRVSSGRWRETSASKRPAPTIDPTTMAVSWIRDIFCSVEAMPLLPG